MFTSLYFYLMVVVVIFAVGDLIGYFTGGRLSGMMMVMLLFLVAFLAGWIPGDIIDQAGLTQLANAATGMVLFNMGTTINIKQMVREWRVVAMAALCMLVSCVAMLCIIPIVGREAVLCGMPVINGAAMATSLMTSAALERGMTTAAALCAVIYSVQKFVGAPIASAMGLRYAKKLMVEFRKDPAKHMAELKARQSGLSSDKVPFYEKHKEIFTANVLIAIVCVASWVGRVLGSLTPINYSIWCLLLGSVSGLGGYLPPKPLQRSSSYGLMMIAVFGSIIPSLAQVNLSDLATMAFQTVMLFIAAVIGIFVIGYILPGWKLVGDRDLAVGIGVEQFLGFPTNVVICREVGQAVGKTDDEKAYIEDTLSIPYVLGGITVVTILSVALAGIVIEIL